MMMSSEEEQFLYIHSPLQPHPNTHQQTPTIPHLTIITLPHLTIITLTIITLTIYLVVPQQQPTPQPPTTFSLQHLIKAQQSPTWFQDDYEESRMLRQPWNMFEPRLSRLRREKELAEGSRSQEEREQLQKGKQFEGRVNYYCQKSRFNSWEYLANVKYHYRNDNSHKFIQQKNQDQYNQHRALKYRYRIQPAHQELPFCIVIYHTLTLTHPHPHNHYSRYSHQFLVNSIINQHYSNYKILYLADGLPQPQTHQIQQFLVQNMQNRSYHFINTNKPIGFLPSLFATINLCDYQEVLNIYYGGDEILSSYLFQLYNSLYQQKRANVILGGYVQYVGERDEIMLGAAHRFSQEDHQHRAYRNNVQGMSLFMSVRKKLFPFVTPQLLSSNKEAGQYIESYKLGLQALQANLLQLSCGRVQFLNETFLLHQTSSNQITASDKSIYQYLSSAESSKCFKLVQILVESKDVVNDSIQLG